MGFKGCSTYELAGGDTPVCTLCTGDYYLSNGTCVAVDSAISNCVLYKDAKECDTCSLTYLPNTTTVTDATNNTTTTTYSCKLVDTVVANCVEYSEDEKCTTC